MRRKDREIVEPKELLGVIDECRVCRIAARDADGLFIIPMNFGYQYTDGKLSLYFHCAKEGRKVDAFKLNNEIAFEMDCGHRLIEDEIACEYGYSYKSIAGNGRIYEVTIPDEKKKALSLLMKQQTGKAFDFNDKMAGTVLIYKIEVSNFTGKQC